MWSCNYKPISNGNNLMKNQGAMYTFAKQILVKEMTKHSREGSSILL